MDNQMPILIGDGLKDNQVKFINAYVNNYCNVSKACLSIDISRETYYAWINKSDTFRQAVEQAKEALKDRWEDEINKQVFEDRNPVVLNKFAPMVLRDRGYADIKDVNLNGQQDNNVVITVVEALEDQNED
jgi:hypothetical protein|tara:strand:- start:587 stop:979 length:393 start_codon:yes stop_codon:yes gene_type:complete